MGKLKYNKYIKWKKLFKKRNITFSQDKKDTGSANTKLPASEKEKSDSGEGQYLDWSPDTKIKLNNGWLRPIKWQHLD